jgi:hypothetical protein
MLTAIVKTILARAKTRLGDLRDIAHAAAALAPEVEPEAAKLIEAAAAFTKALEKASEKK